MPNMKAAAAVMRPGSCPRGSCPHEKPSGSCPHEKPSGSCRHVKPSGSCLHVKPPGSCPHVKPPSSTQQDTTRFSKCCRWPLNPMSHVQERPRDKAPQSRKYRPRSTKETSWRQLQNRSCPAAARNRPPKPQLGGASIPVHTTLTLTQVDAAQQN